LTSTTGAIFLGFGSAVTSSTTGAPAWSTTATTTGPAQSIGITVTSASGVNYLGYAVITATASNALVGTTAITVSQSDLWRVRIDATTPGNVVLSAINASWPASIGWQTVYTYTGGAFTVPLQPIISVSKSNDASAINLYVRYIGIQNVKP
jgi:hypothetical protein